MGRYRIHRAIALLGAALGLVAATEAQEGWNRVEIRANEYLFAPKEVRAKAGRPLALVIINEGHEPHQFRSDLFKDRMTEVEIAETVVRGRGIEVVDVAPGGRATIKVLSPPAGEFDYQCRIPSHHGMDGILIIEK